MLFYFLGKLLFLLIYKKITWMLTILWVIISESKNFFCHFQNNYNYIKHNQQGLENNFQKEIQVYLIRELSFQIIRGSCKKNILASLFHSWNISSKQTVSHCSSLILYFPKATTFSHNTKTCLKKKNSDKSNGLVRWHISAEQPHPTHPEDVSSTPADWWLKTDSHALFSHFHRCDTASMCLHTHTHSHALTCTYTLNA